jgi:hypothetical protein
LLRLLLHRRFSKRQHKPLASTPDLLPLLLFSRLLEQEQAAQRHSYPLNVVERLVRIYWQAS